VASPARIASLYPSATDTLAALGVAERVVARTTYCPRVGQSTVIGGTKNPDLSRLRDASPDLVFACKDENRREDIEAIRAFAEVHVTDPRRVADVPPLLRALGRAAGAEEAAERLAREIEDAAAARARDDGRRRRALALIWRDPWWSIGADAYASDLMRLCGLDNVFRADPRAYFPAPPAILDASAPDVLLLPDEPFRFGPADIEAFLADCPALARAVPKFFDGSLLTWHGARTLRALRELPGILT
jgi:ABC-type Fe3+-hydroxamate transport system substrate-binding protein